MEKITVKGRTFVDSYGRERIFNGVNVCDKGCFNGTKRVYAHSWDESVFDECKALGVNLIRLGTTWDAIEPVPGQYNTEYLDAIASILDECEKHGIYAFIDMHQDLYSGFGGLAGDGAPDWATITDGYKMKPAKLVWAEGYFWRKAVHRAFDNFWNNTRVGDKGLQDYYADMWKEVAGRVMNHPALFGFDLMNEPFPGSDGGKVFRNIVKNAIKVTLTDKRINKLRLIRQGLNKNERVHVLDMYTGDIIRKITRSSDDIMYRFDVARYTPFVAKMTKAIRSVTDNGIIIMEHSYYSNTGIPFSAPPISVNGVREPNQCYSPHGYDLMVDTPAYKYANADRVGSIFQQAVEAQSRLDIPVVVGEFGGNSTGTEWLPHIEYLLDMFDSNKWSYTYWENSAAFLNRDLNETLRHPYPRAVTGEIDSYRFDRDDNCFILDYTQKKDFEVPTEIYLHKKPSKVKTDGEYTLTDIEGTEGCILTVTTGIGEHHVKASF